MRSSFALRFVVALAMTGSLAACDHDGPTAARTTPPPPPLLTAMRCDASVAGGTVACTSATPEIGANPLLVGGQHLYVEVTSSNVVVGGGTFSFDVTVKNLIRQAMATTDGATPTAAGVRVFFNAPPVTTEGSGTVVVANPDGLDAFTGTNQPYFQYSGALLGADQMLSPAETSGSKNWQLTLDPGVSKFSFVLYVFADVRYENGWIDLFGSAPNLLSGDSLTLGDTVRTAVGAVLPGAPVVWTTSDSSVATVDGAGKVRSVGPGTVTITATSGPRTGMATISVCPSLAVGGVYTGVMPRAASLCFGGGASGQEFTYMPINLSTSSALSLTVTGSGIQAVTGPPTPDRAPSTAFQLSRGDAGGLTIVDHVARLDRERAEMNGLLARRGRARQPARSGGARFNVTPGVPVIGDLMNLNTNTACNGSPVIRTGQVRTVSQHLIIVSDTANPAGGFTNAQYDSIALEFDTIAWPVDSANFGPPTDLDGNGRVVAFYTRAVNELSPPASSQVTTGFFASKDVFGTNDCTNSNGQATVGTEIFYMLVPDPTGVVNSNVRTASFVRSNTTGTLGHEFQHMINGLRRGYVTGADFFEEGYLNEGLSHIAEELMFYRASGMSPGVNIRRGADATSGIQLNSRRVAAYNTYSSQNFTRLRSWLQRPDTAGAFTPHANSLAVRGAIWAFLRYAADRTGGTQSSFWFNLVNSNLEGKANIQKAIGANPDLWLRDFTAAMYADDNAFTVAAAYQTPSWNYRDLYALLYGTYQLTPRSLSNNVGSALLHASGGATAYYRFGVPASGFATLGASGAGGVVPSSPYALIMVRTK